MNIIKKVSLVVLVALVFNSLNCGNKFQQFLADLKIKSQSNIFNNLNCGSKFQQFLADLKTKSQSKWQYLKGLGVDDVQFGIAIAKEQAVEKLNDLSKKMRIKDFAKSPFMKAFFVVSSNHVCVDFVDVIYGRVYYTGKVEPRIESMACFFDTICKRSSALLILMYASFLANEKIESLVK